MDDNTRALIVFALVGIVAGFLASIIVGGGGLIQYLLSGVIGAFVGGYLLRLLGVNLGISNPLVSQIVTSTIGAIVVVLVARMIS
ncbi:MAG: GlsB/YeaQ/YmgE family stress response membrane protein [Hyphomicrobiaceae bacterium]|nr:GlsB/YeaQ/YmgE family stress response membrane protein [Hyphomicrobiaceae bacterium]